MDVYLRNYQVRDFDFARRLYFETMRWAIERLFGWDQAHQERSFTMWFNPGGTSYDEPDIHAAETDPGGPAAATVAGRAADLDCWLWHRPPVARIERSGDAEVLSGFESAIAPGIS
jgi:hypothetical protein